MVYRKGEEGPGRINRNYPYQLAFPWELERDLLRGAQFYPSAAPRSLMRIIDGHRHVIICFADAGDRERFQRHAGGVVVPQGRRMTG